MSDFKEGLYNALKNLLVSLGFDVVRVTDFEDGMEATGYCETCYYEYAVVYITYVDSNNKTRKYTYSGSFSSLVSSF